MIRFGKILFFKKQLLLLVLVLTIASSFGQSLCKQQLRSLYLQSLQRRSALDSFIYLLRHKSKLSPVEESYLGICNGLLAQYADGMWSKLHLVREAKALLNESVERDPKDPELHFMRFTLEHFLPSFLGMSGDITQDLKTIFSDIHFVDDNPELKKMVMEFLLYTKRCNVGQKQLVENALTDLNKKAVAQK